VAWTEPTHAKPEIDAAGKVLRDAKSDWAAKSAALGVLDNWRASHAYPLNTFQMILRRRSREISSQPLVVQRLKRVPSVLRKLNAEPTMRLSQMQDIGGCRSVVRGLSELGALRDMFIHRRTSGDLLREKDYVTDPKSTGYRSIHLVYRYRSRQAHRRAFDGLLIEIQLRTLVQHAWATAVETLGTMTGLALKSSSGPDQWLDLMRNISSLFALYEGTPVVAGAPSSTALIRLVRRDLHRLELVPKLRAYRQALRLMEDPRNKGHRYFLMHLTPGTYNLALASFREEELRNATQLYLDLERESLRDKSDVVLVRADSVEALRRAYPNYFLDTEYFLQVLAGFTGPLAAS
jgi:hypothetical protein